MKKIVITGATGMLGISLINKCIGENIEVLAIIRPNSHRRNNIPNSPLVKILECDNDNLLSINTEDNYDVFYHFGWKATAHETRNDPTYQTENIKQTLEAVKLAYQLGCEGFIGAGSQAEYGRVNGMVSPDSPVNPDSAYGISKYAAGRLAGLLCRELNIRFIWTRVFSVYGEHDGANTLISSCIRNLTQNQTIEVTPSEQIWDYLYESDCAEALYLLGLKGKNQVLYNIGSGEGQALKYYLHIIGQILNKESLINIGAKPYSENQVMFLQANIDLLKTHTGFSPRISFEEGIQKIIKGENCLPT
ncbi:MAG: NAD-dependent epimerase/dehydratase family protein [Brevinemataceae bacterium]